MAAMLVFQTDPVGVLPFPLQKLSFVQIKWRRWTENALKRRVREWKNNKRQRATLQKCNFGSRLIGLRETKPEIRFTSPTYFFSLILLVSRIFRPPFLFVCFVIMWLFTGAKIFDKLPLNIVKSETIQTFCLRARHFFLW